MRERRDRWRMHVEMSVSCVDGSTDNFCALAMASSASLEFSARFLSSGVDMTAKEGEEKQTLGEVHAAHGEQGGRTREAEVAGGKMKEARSGSTIS